MCPLCGCTNIETHLQVTDNFLTGEEFTISRCHDCGFRFTNPRPEAEQLGRYYKSENYIAHSNTHKGFIARLYQMVRNQTLQQKYRLIAKSVPKGTILDIGCATGEFLSVFKSKGWKSIGIEPDSDAAGYAKTNYALDVFGENELNSLPANSCDVITMWHVMEHVDDLSTRVEQIKRLLKPGALVFVAVPNPNSWDAVHYDKNWAALDVPRHLSHFSQSNMQFLFVTNKNFEIVNTLPMIFDSFYVSLLSEKYLKSVGGIFRAFFVGLRSNIKASQNGEYSSLIYVFQKKMVD